MMQYLNLLFTIVCFGIIVCEQTANTNAVRRKPGSEEGKLYQQLVQVNKADFNKNYTGTVHENSTDLYEFSYKVSDKNITAVRLATLSWQSEASFPTIFVVRRERSVMSWQIPLVLEYKYEYIDVSRTLCPLDTNTMPSLADTQHFFVEVSTQSANWTQYTLYANILPDFDIRTDVPKTVISSPSNPVYYMYTFPRGVESVLVTAKSDDKKCSTLSIQNTKCPVFDLDTNIHFQGKYQTMTTQGAIAVDRSDGDSFYLVLVVKSNDFACSNGFQSLSPAGIVNSRHKTLTISVRETIPSYQYYKATLVAAAFFLAFYLVAVLIGIFYHGCKENYGLIGISVCDRSMSDEGNTSRPIKQLVEGVNNYGATSGTADDSITDHSSGGTTIVIANRGDNPGRVMGRCEQEDLGSVDSLNSDDFDFIRDAERDKEIRRTKTALYVCDLARKKEKRMKKHYKLYATNLFTIFVFYGLPVIQLVMTYQRVLNFTGNEDICYYNFACAHGLGSVSAFNNIYSNIGYVLLGLLFLILVARRDFLHRKAVEKSEGREKLFGIPQHFGLFYAMGLALCMEGVMSACYHVCPTVSNFQFDTSFMYIMACLCILKIYQNRHTDISAKSHSSYFVMALIIIVAVIGVVYGTNVFWIIFCLLYVTASLVLSIHIYYMGQWQIDRHVCKRLWLLFHTDWIKCTKPMYLNRMVLLVLGNLVNWAIAIYGAITTNKSDFASFLLGIFIVNLLLYTVFYLVSKISSCEKIPKLTKAFIVLSMASWGAALYFFFAHLTSWQLSPAESRAGNRSCILLGFYDSHDVWHFLSAVSLFFSFLVILTLDDELIRSRRDKIPVF